MFEPLCRCYCLWCFLLLSGFVNTSSAQFTDYSSEADVYISSEIAMWGCGMSAFDFNTDGFDDLTIAENLLGIALFQSDGDGSFTLVDYLALNAVIKQVVWVDFDNDLDADLFATTNGSGFFLYERMVDGSLIHRADLFAEYGQFDGQGASWVDYDKDGWKDLFVCSYLYGQAPEYPNLLFHNEQGVFTEVGAQMGVASWVNQAFQGVWTDFDRDGWHDLYVINDHEVGNEYYRNNGGMGFENLSAVNGSAMALASMSNSVADYDRDGDFDVFVSNGGYQALLQYTDGIFENIAPQLGITVFTFGWSGLWIDYDNDGWQDLYLCNTNGYANGDQNFFWANQSGTSFSEVPFDPYAMSSFVAVTGDFNNDRFPDVAVYNGYPSEIHVWINDSGSGQHAIKLNLRGVVSDHFGVGAEVSAYIDGGINLHQVMAGENYLSQNTSSVIIGCGSASIVDSLVVAWPSGWRDIYYNLPVDSLYTLTEGETFEVMVESVDDFLMCPEASCQAMVVVSDPLFEGSIAWSTGDQGFNAVLSDTGSYSVTVTNTFGLQRTRSFAVAHHAQPVVEKTISAPLCHGQDNGQCVITSADIGSLDGSVFQSSLTLSNLSAGTHTYTIVDLNGCTSEIDVLVPERPEISMAQSTVTVCANAPDYPELDIAHASPPLTMEWMGGTGGAQWPEAGGYSLALTDANGCLANLTVFIEHFPLPQITLFADTVCAGNTTAFTWVASGDVEVLEVLAADGNQGQLDAGNHLLQVHDAFGCVSDLSFTVNEFPPLHIDLTLDESNQLLQAAVTGGVMPYALEWSDGSVESSIEASEDGLYTLSIIDAAGCAMQADTLLVLSHVGNSMSSRQFIATAQHHHWVIESPASGHLTVYDLQGRVVHSAYISPGRHTVDGSAWPAGRYVARVEISDK